MTRAAPVLLALAAIAAVLVPYVALGGASYAPTPVSDPCETRGWRDPGGLPSALEQVVLSALDGAACTLDVSREELVLALRTDASLNAFATERGITREDAERAVSDGLARAVDDAEEAGVLPGFTASLVRRAASSVPPRLLLELLERLDDLLP
ncbi:MAG TPA: hypothetical protein VK926_05525 [Gaiellaceae bacterium]|nr:hypothetical protein [Gaiellaceae bacterium]